MSEYPSTANGASVKCISCNAPTTRTVAGRYVCVNCGRSPVNPHAGATDGGTNESLLDDVVGRSSLGEPDLRGARQEAPAVALIATPENVGDLLTRTLRAVDAGHAVFVTYSDRTELEGVRLAAKVGAYIVDPHTSDPDVGTLEQELIVTAKAYSYPGVIYQPEVDVPIDYDRSVDALEATDAYCVEAVPDTPERSIETLAAIPAYNEAETIAGVVAEAKDHADAVVVVDDGSADDTPDRAREAGARVVEHDTNRGYGRALKTAFEWAERADVDHLVLLDGDGQHDPSDIPELIDAQRRSKAEIVVGSRFADGSKTELPLYRWLGLTVVNALTNFSMGVVRSRAYLRDTQSGFRVYDRTAIESLADDVTIATHMDASTDILHHAHRQGYDIEEVGTTIDYDVENGSSHNPFVHGWVLVSNLLQTIERDRPITSLAIPGLAITLAGLGFGYWTISNYIQTETFPLGLALAASFFSLTGIFACFTAIILHSLNQHLDT